MSSTADVIRALEDGWASIHARHPKLPNVVIVVGPTSKGGKLTRLGHFAKARWHGEGDERWGEVLVSAESLQNPVDRIFTTLLHEATHALADATDVKDTSRNGVYHNARFRDLAETLGCECCKGGRIGWTTPGLQGWAADEYAADIARLRDALRCWRGIEPTGESKTKQPTKATCDCGRILRMSEKVFELGPVVCGVCGADFEPEN